LRRQQQRQSTLFVTSFAGCWLLPQDAIKELVQLVITTNCTALGRVRLWLYNDSGGGSSSDNCYIASQQQLSRLSLLFHFVARRCGLLLLIAISSQRVG
jgi:hypothetical protein